jgi:hypothetical protein
MQAVSVVRYSVIRYVAYKVSDQSRNGLLDLATENKISYMGALLHPLLHLGWIVGSRWAMPNVVKECRGLGRSGPYCAIEILGVAFMMVSASDLSYNTNWESLLTMCHRW